MPQTTPRGMKIVHEEPPFLGAIFAAGMSPRVQWSLFAYGDTLYIPGGFVPNIEVLHHEDVHMKQQEEYEGGPDAWWERYLDDSYFRVEQEMQAYTKQCAVFNSTHRDRNQQVKYQVQVADQLAGPLYGNVIGKGDALRMLRHRLNK